MILFGKPNIPLWKRLAENPESATPAAPESGFVPHQQRQTGFSRDNPPNPRIFLQPRPEMMAHHLPSRVRISPRMTLRLPRPSLRSSLPRY